MEIYLRPTPTMDFDNLLVCEFVASNSSASSSTLEHAPRTTSAAPFEYAVVLPGVSCSVVIRFRSELNGISAVRGY